MGQIQINYKSGTRMVVECDTFTATKKGGKLTAVEWSDAKPRPLHISVDDIESVWEL